MAHHIGVSGVWRPIARQYIGVSGTWHLILRRWIGVDGVWRLYYSAAPIVSISPTFVQGASSTSPVYSGNATANVTGGSGSYTYSWSQVDGDAMNIESPTSATTRFYAAIPSGQSRSATMRCTVTDTITGQSSHADCSVQLDRF